MADSQAGSGAVGASGGSAEASEGTSVAAVDQHPALPSFMTMAATIDATDEEVHADAVEESNVPGDNGDSDDEAPEVEDTVASVREWHSTIEDERDVQVVDNEADAVPLSLNIYRAPDGWQPKARQRNKGEPAFGHVDNPGHWPEFIFRPEFSSSTKKYVRHSLPTGATPVPVNNDGKRIANGWEFHYKGWKKADDMSIPESLRNKQFRQGSLPK